MSTFKGKNKTRISGALLHDCRILLPLLLLSISLHSCKENEFPVSELPDPFAYIPPDDVAMLTAEGGDGQITLTWAAALEGSLKAIHVTNLNTGDEEVLSGNASEVVFTGLTNYTKYTFKVCTESFQEQLSYGVTISTKPYGHDNVKPGQVVNLIGYRLSDEMAFAVWEAPEDIDIHSYVVTLGTSSVTVNEETFYATITGDMSQSLEVRAVDYSGNISEPVRTTADAPAVTIDGYDDGDTETIQIHKDPIITAVTGYRITYFDQSYTSDAMPLPEVYQQTMPVDNGQPLWLDGAKTQGSWLTPVVVTLLAGEEELTSYDYLTYNNVPGTLMLTHATMLNEEGVNVRRNNDGRSFGSNLGNFTGDGKLPIYGIYEINVLEDGEYATEMWFSFSGTKTYKLTVDDGPTIEGVTGGGTDNWDYYVPAPGPVLSLTQGKHQLKVEYPSGGHNFKKLVFTKQ